VCRNDDCCLCIYDEMNNESCQRKIGSHVFDAFDRLFHTSDGGAFCSFVNYFSMIYTQLIKYLFRKFLIPLDFRPDVLITIEMDSTYVC